MKSLVLYLGVCVLVYAPTQAHAQWQQRALNGQGVHGLLTNGSLAYGGTDVSGFYLSTNDGASWTQQNNGLTTSLIKAFAVIASNLFAAGAGAGSAGVYMTTNNGANWTAVNSGLSNTTVHSLISS